MVHTGDSVDDDNSLTTKATWNDDLTRIFCELCVTEVDAGNKPTTYLNSRGWENVIAHFKDRTGLCYGKRQLKNKWDTLKKGWKLWTDLLRNESGIGWCSIRNNVDATEEWWIKKIQENFEFKTFKKRGIEPGLNDLMWRMFGGDTVASGSHSGAPSSRVIPSGNSIEDAIHTEGLGDSYDSQNDDEIQVDTHNGTSSNGIVGVIKDKDKNKIPPRKTVRKKMTSQIDKLGANMGSPRKSISTLGSLPSQYSIQEAMNSLRELESEVPKKGHLYYFATKIFQNPVKREMFLCLDPDMRSWWLHREFDDQNSVASYFSWLSTQPSYFPPFHRPPPTPSASQGPIT